ncbi:AAA-ATPase ASD, mitochondrial [Ancistrocladus abbreviatus]
MEARVSSIWSSWNRQINHDYGHGQSFGVRHLRRLLIETTSKSIIVIEDIDCSVDLTGQRKKKKDKDDTKGEEDPLKKKLKEDDDKKGSQVTLSRLLNVIDGIWSSCGEERLIIFTTNFIQKLDPALIGRGRMDMHIEMSYCGFEAFKVLAKNYLDLDSHDLFPTIKRLLEETSMIPADVAENLMSNSSNVDVNVCLENLVKEVEKTKEDAKLKVKEERKLKEKEAEEDKKLKEKEAEAKKATDAEVAKEKKTSDDELKGKEENKDGESEKN